jgi:hypothetical protein
MRRHLPPRQKQKRPERLRAKRLAEIPWDIGNFHQVVMAQWSSGKYVPQWTSVIQKIQEHPSPDAVLHPGPTSTYLPILNIGQTVRNRT